MSSIRFAKGSLLRDRGRVRRTFVKHVEPDQNERRSSACTSSTAAGLPRSGVTFCKSPWIAR